MDRGDLAGARWIVSVRGRNKSKQQVEGSFIKGGQERQCYPQAVKGGAVEGSLEKRSTKDGSWMNTFSPLLTLFIHRKDANEPGLGLLGY